MTRLGGWRLLLAVLLASSSPSSASASAAAASNGTKSSKSAQVEAAFSRHSSHHQQQHPLTPRGAQSHFVDTSDPEQRAAFDAGFAAALLEAQQNFLQSASSSTESRNDNTAAAADSPVERRRSNHIQRRASAKSSSSTARSIQPTRSKPTSKSTSSSSSSSKTTSSFSSSASKPATYTSATPTPTPKPTPAQPQPVTTQSPGPGCRANYIAPSMIRGTGELPKPTSFVYRQGTQLYLDGKPFTINGPNMYWLCHDGNVGGAATSKKRVREGLAIAVAMGATTVRLATCGTSSGQYYDVEPQLNQFGTWQWDIHDYVLYAAREYGIRVILPMTDNYDYGSEGKYQFLRWSPELNQNKPGNDFYYDQNLGNNFRHYIEVLLAHRNSYTGVLWRDDPTIVAFETGNEMGAYMGQEGYPPYAWTDNIAWWIKQHAPHALVIDGSDGILNYNGVISQGVYSPYVDISSDHAYPRKLDLIDRERAITNRQNKVLLIGEYDWSDWSDSRGGVTVNDFCSYLGGNGIGDMLWGVFGHDDECCNYIQHNDGFSLYYPDGNGGVNQQYILRISQHWHYVNGRTIPQSLIGVTCPQPVF